MKFFSIVTGLQLLIFLVTNSKADISLSLRNKPYLPPPTQEVPIKDDYYTNTHENTQQQQQQTFKESNYGNSHYHIFEVHNHYKSPIANRQTVKKPSSVKTNYINNEYLPAQSRAAAPKSEEIHIEHINAPADFPLDDPNLDASYLGLADDDQSQQEIIVKHEFKSKQTSANNIPIPFPSNYRHEFPENSHKKVKQIQSQQQQTVSRLKDPPTIQDYTRQPQQKSKIIQAQVHKSTQTLGHKREYLPPIPTKLNAKGVTAEYVQNQQSNTKNKVFNSLQQNAQNIAENIPHEQILAKQQQQSLAHNQQQHQYQQHHQRSLQSQQNFPQSSSFKGQDYLPPHNHQNQVVLTSKQNLAKQHLQSIEKFLPQQQGSLQPRQSLKENAFFKGPDYLPPHQHQHQQQSISQSQQQLPQSSSFKGQDYLPPHINKQQQLQGPLQSQGNLVQNIPYKGPDYLPPHQNQQIVEQAQQNISPNAPFKGPDYLPPYQQPHQTKSQTNENLLYQQQQKQVFRPSAPYKGPDYLSPHQPQQTPNTPFKGPDYLPPGQQQQRETQFESINAFKGPDYLPPRQENHNANAPFKGPDYLPPLQHEQYQQFEQHLQILPEGYDFQKPANAEQAIAELHTLPVEQSKSHYHDVKMQSQIQVSGPERSGEIVYGSPKQLVPSQPFLPPGYLSQKPTNFENAIQQLHNQIDTTTNREIVNQVSSHQLQEVSHSDSSIPGLLPAGYDFPRPANAKQAISQLHSQRNSFQPTQLNQASQNYGGQTLESYQQSNNLQPSSNFQNQGLQQQTIRQQDFSIVPSRQTSFQQKVQPAQQQIKSAAYLPPVTGSKTFKGPDYLPPTITSTKTFSGTSKVNNNPNHLTPTTTGNQYFKGPDYLPPKVSSQSVASVDHEFKSQVNSLPPVGNVQAIAQDDTNYLQPPTAATIVQSFQPTVMYPLSSFMANIKPSDRYAKERKPFPEYGLPPPTEITQVNSIDVSSMFSEPTSRLQYYAPGMSYSNYAIEKQNIGASALNRHTQERLKTLMPQEIRQQQQVSKALRVQATPIGIKTEQPAIKPISSKIRTVQIVKPNAIKTLKVLESVDHAGVKTIKILGPSLDVPMGEHRIINVVDSGHEHNVHTVKIFNDHQDATPLASQQSQGNDAYLPTRQKRNPISKLKVEKHGRL